MNSVKFGEKDSYADWGLVLRPKARPLASPKTNIISIEGKDGDLDLTTALTGDVKYNNVSYALEFTLTDKRENWESRIQEITTYLHGKRMNVIFSEDPDWYCVGRMTVGELNGSTGLGVIKITCDFEPYKLKAEETVIKESIEEGKVITLSNSRKWIMPTIKTLSRNLYNCTDVLSFGDIVSVDENGWITVNYDNTNGKSTKYFDFKTNDINLLKTSNKYKLVIEIKEVSGDGDISFANNQKTSQSKTIVYYEMSSLTTGTMVFDINTKENFDGCTSFLNSYGSFSVGKSGSIIFRLSVLEDTSITTDTFVYEPYIDTYANFEFEGASYSVSGTLKTPNIILKEGGSKITLKNGVGNIEISYREGKL